MNFSKNLPSDWQPPHCPSPKCPYHKPLPGGFPFKKRTPYTRKCDGRRIQRYACKTCGVTFSSQTFSTTYWLKKPELIKQVFMKIVGGMANRQIARDLQVKPATIDRLIDRLGRHCLLLHWSLLQGIPPPSEIVVDGFETFELSQYFPIHHHLAVEKGTDFFIYFTDSPLRRKGRMTKAQKIRRAELEEMFGPPDPQAIRKDMTHLLAVSLAGQTSAVVYSDDHMAYRRAIRDVACEITHQVTPSKAYRDWHNKLWEVNLLDLLIRHSSANHKRETIAWSKRRQCSAYRLAIFLVWRNYMKGRREKQRSSPTPAMTRGMFDRPLELDEVLFGRIFRTHVCLPKRWAEYYDRKVVTRALPINREHDLTYAR